MGTTERDSAGFACGVEKYSISLVSVMSPRTSELAWSPLDLGIDDVGNVHVLDRELRAVRVYGPRGKLRREITPSGTNGELSAGGMWGLATTGSGTNFVWDAAQQRILKLDTLGRITGFTALGQPFGLPSSIQSSDDGMLAIGVKAMEGDRLSEVVRLFDHRGASLGGLGPFEIASSVVVRSEKFTSSVALPSDLSTRRVWALSPDHSVLIADSRSYRIVAYAGADTLWVLQRDVPLVRVTPADVTAALRLAGTTGVTERAVRRMIPRNKSLILELVVTREWLFVRRPIEGPFSYSVLYDVFRVSDREFCVTALVPARILAARGGLAAGISYTDEQRPVVHLYSLRRVDQ